MISKNLLRQEVQQFIRSYEGDLTELALKGSPFPDISIQDLIIQVESRLRIKQKLPTWFHQENLIYPPKLNLEQTSSEITAAYKSKIITGETLADLTGGFGIDSYYFAEHFKSVAHFEINSSLSQIAAHNFEVFGKKNVSCLNKDGIKDIEKSFYDVIYVDPSRRSAQKGKVFLLSDCVPDVVKHLDLLLDSCKTILIKTSPMLDISSGLRELHSVEEIHIVAVENEVKELLWLIRKNPKPLKITTKNFNKGDVQSFSFYKEKPGQATYGLPETYLYEPNAAILKSGSFQLISEKFQLKKLHPHTHLYTSHLLVSFPGRRFKIEASFPYQKKILREKVMGKKINVSIRNFPESVKDLKKRWKIKDGGSTYGIFTTVENGEKIVLLCSKE